MNEIVRTIRIGAGLAWAALLVSSAAAANAVVRTTSSGSYALVLTQHSASFEASCGYTFNYRQAMRFSVAPCNQGGSCNAISEPPDEPVEAVYTGGRKTTSYVEVCSGYNIYALASCRC